MKQQNYDKNKFTRVLFNVVKENIMRGKKPIDNPIFIYGLNIQERFNFFWRVFDKDFNKTYKEKYKYINCKDFIEFNQIDKNEKVMIIIENIDCLTNDNTAQKKLYNFIIDCMVDTNIQLILCSSNHIDNLDIEKCLKAEILSGIVVNLEK